MTPITQTETGDEGNCFSACLASILHVPLSEVPNFHKDDDKSAEAWWKRVRAWLAPHGFGIVCMTVDASNVENPLHWYHPEAYLIVSGKSERGIDHATIWHGGKMVHDPHPSRGGIKAPEFLDLLYPLDPSEITRLRAELAASQAREAQMREVLWTAREFSNVHFGPQHSLYIATKEAHALPHDTTALDARIRAKRAKERERCARLCETQVETGAHFRCAAAIRKLGDE